jgi:hypothetical protein
MSSKKLKEADLIRLMSEEWDKKIFRLNENLDLFKDDKGKPVISPGLELTLKEKDLTGNPTLYTVIKVDLEDQKVFLRDPTEKNREIPVSFQNLEKDYEI